MDHVAHTTLKYRKRRIPWSAVFAGLIAFSAIAFLNADGYHNEPFGNGNFYDEPPDINWTHGWPFICLGRSSVVIGPLVVTPPTRRITSRWPIRDVKPTYFYPGAMAADAAIAFLFVIASA